MAPGPDWKWIGDQVRIRRESLRLSQAAVVSRVAATGNEISVTWLYQIEQARGARSRQPMKLAMLAEALKWPKDAFDYLKDGRLPPGTEDLDVVIESGDRMIVLEAKVDRLIELLERQETAPSSERGAHRPSR